MNARNECWISGHWEHQHGNHCDCRLLAEAAGADSSAIDYHFCHVVAQKRWRMTCDHIPQVLRKKATPSLPPHDSHDPIDLLLIGNAYAPHE